MTAYATLVDLEARYPGDLTSAQEDSATVMLDDASFILALQAPTLQAQIDGGDQPAIHLAMLLVVAMVKRALQAQTAQDTADPSVDSLSQAYGPFTSSIKYRAPSTNLFLYESEFEQLQALLRGDVATAVSFRSSGL